MMIKMLASPASVAGRRFNAPQPVFVSGRFAAEAEIPGFGVQSFPKPRAIYRQPCFRNRLLKKFGSIRL
jgi:hypothetical protein